MAKKTKINFNKTNTQMIAKTLYANEGVISKDKFLSFASQTTLQKYINEGYLTKIEDGYYKATSSYTQSFRRNYGQINSKYADAHFEASRSLTHSKGIEKITNAIDPRDLLKNVEIRSGANLTDDYSHLRKDNYTKEIFTNLENKTLANISNLENQISEIRNNVNESNILELRKLENELEKEQLVIESLETKNQASPPDLELTMPMDCFHNQIENLKSQLEELDNPYSKEYHSLESTINQMETIEARALETFQTEITYCVEAVTDNYRGLDLQLKENYSLVRNIEIVYVRV